MSKVNQTNRSLEDRIAEAVERYLDRHGYVRLDLKTAMFDMDGVLFDSMPWHAQSWHRTMAHFGFTLSEQEAYMHEGRTGASTINIVSLRERGHEATAEEIEAIYSYKSKLFNECPTAPAMPGAGQLLQAVKNSGLTPVLVTGSGQHSLLQRLERNYPGMFCTEHMVTAYDVERGKPDPEPYLMGLQKGGGLRPGQSFIVENAPLGVKAGSNAGVFTIAANTGPLADDILIDAGADIVFPSMQALADAWPVLHTYMTRTEVSNN